MDNAGEYTSQEAEALCHSVGIRTEMTPAYRQGFNGVAECHIKDLMSLVRPLLKSSNMPPYTWDFAVEYAQTLRNCTPRASTWDTPM